ncbi:MAG TPA: prepilin-type N-terminal cleavage/methylation domain-containing protein [Candidatus Acidoferrales bacterium]|nr:prepilin-type N-terminal cleavage/methylation domain-containing protein [Candidatus Acidoferrales bacterium]
MALQRSVEDPYMHKDGWSPARGFTLIELIIVVAIISILAAILIPNFLHARAEATSAACEGNLKQLATALEEYAVDNSGQYPPSSGPVNVNLFGGSGNPYLNAIPNDPAGGSYYYTTPGNFVCAGSMYKLSDGNNHDTTTLTQLPNYGAGITGIRWCQGSGLSACLC